MEADSTVAESGEVCPQKVTTTKGTQRMDCSKVVVRSSQYGTTDVII